MTVIDLRDVRDEFTVRPPVGLVFGGGGAFGIAWHVAVIDALRDHGFALENAPALGTSAGSWACAALRLGLGFDEFSAIGTLNVPDRRPGLLAGIAHDLVGDARADGVRISAVELPRMRRRLLDGALHPLADLMAASSAVPGLFASHPIGGIAHVDGGVRSMASADHAVPVDLLVASLPIAGSLFGPVGRIMESTSRAALSRWKSRTGGSTLVLRPGKRLAALIGLRPGAMFDIDLAKRVYPIAYDQVSERLEARRPALAIA